MRFLFFLTSENGKISGTSLRCYEICHLGIMGDSKWENAYSMEELHFFTVTLPLKTKLSLPPLLTLLFAIPYKILVFFITGGRHENVIIVLFVRENVDNFD